MIDEKRIREVEQEIEETVEWRLNHLEAVEGHAAETDYLLRAACAVAKMGHHEIESTDTEEAIDRVSLFERFEAIVDLIELYRQQRQDFIESLYEKRKANKAGEAA